MSDKRLNIVSVGNEKSPKDRSYNYAGGKTRRMETQAYFDRLWLIDPEQFNPLRNCLEQERLQRTFKIIQKHLDLQDKKAVDLGCGSGVFSRMLRDAGCSVDALDISENALKKLKESDMARMRAIQDYVPSTTLPDYAYDLVVCAELIADLNSDEYRLLISELVRLVKKEGFIVGSTALDINSMDALQRFADLVETEVHIDEWSFGYHRLYIRLSDFFEAASRFVRAGRDPEYRSRGLKERYGLSRWWFNLNSARIPSMLWSLLQWPCKPFVHILKNNRTLLLSLEKICKFFWSTSGITEAIFIGKCRPMLMELPPEERPKEMKHKRQVWE